MTTTNDGNLGLLAGRRIAVTGANRGLGAALAKAFVEAGADVLVHARSADAAALSLSDSGARGAVAGELVDPRLGPELAAKAREVLAPGLDVLVLNAGIISTMGKLEDADMVEFRHVMEVNVDAQLRLFVACLPQLLASRGTVIWMSSGVGRFGVPGYGAYGVSKHALEGLHRAAHAEYGAQGLVSLAVAPGMVQTDMLRAARGTQDVSAFTPPPVAAAGFVRLLAAINERRDELAGASVDIDNF